MTSLAMRPVVDEGPLMVIVNGTGNLKLDSSPAAISGHESHRLKNSWADKKPCFPHPMHVGIRLHLGVEDRIDIGHKRLSLNCPFSS